MTATSSTEQASQGSEPQPRRSSQPSAGRETKLSWSDVLFDAFYSGAIGGSIVALFFLPVDWMRGELLFTPTVMGKVLFTSTPASAVGDADLGMVALYTGVHIVSFLLLGLVASLAVNQVQLRSRHPAVALAVLFLVVEGAFALFATLFMPGVIAVIGPAYVAAANLLAAAGMGVFFLESHVWQRLTGTVRA